MLRFRRNEKRFIEEVLLRMERSERRTAAVQQEMIQEIRDHRREFRAEYQAQRGSLLAILDRLDKLDPPGWRTSET